MSGFPSTSGRCAPAPACGAACTTRTLGLSRMTPLWPLVTAVRASRGCGPVAPARGLTVADVWLTCQSSSRSGESTGSALGSMDGGFSSACDRERASSSTSSNPSISSKHASNTSASSTHITGHEHTEKRPGIQAPWKALRATNSKQTAAASVATVLHPKWSLQSLLQLLTQVGGQAKALLHSRHDAAIWALALPSIIALAADPLLAMVDTAIVGQLGEYELAALGVNNSLFSFAFVMFNFLSVATTPMVAAALAADDTPKAGQTISQALILAGVLGAVVTSGLEIESDGALRLMGLGDSDLQLLSLAKSFLVIRATAAPAALLVTVSQGVFRGLQDMRTPLVITLATNLLHLGLSLVFIYPCHMGLPGAALSTTISEWLAAGTYLHLGWQRREQLGLQPWPATAALGEIREQYMPFFKAGGAILMRTTVLLGTKTLASVVATRLGPASIASHQVLTQVWVLSSLIIDSLGIAGQTMVAVSLGTGERHVAREVTDRLLQLGVALGVLLSGLLLLASPVWPHLFTQDAGVISGVGALLPLAAAMLPINALVYVLDGALVGASDFQFLVVAMVAAAGSTTGLLLMVEPLDLQLPGIWGAMVMLMVGRLATLMWRYQSAQGPLPPAGSTCPRLFEESSVIAEAAAFALAGALDVPPLANAASECSNVQVCSTEGLPAALPRNISDVVEAQLANGLAKHALPAAAALSPSLAACPLAQGVDSVSAAVPVSLPANEMRCVQHLLYGAPVSKQPYSCDYRN